jgi:periplasmic protein TonB
MRGQSKAFACSIGIHVLVCMLVLGLIGSTTPEKRTLIIDFSLGGQSPATQSSQPFYRTIPAKMAGRAVSPERNVVREPAPRIQRMAVAEDPVAVATPEPTQSFNPDSGVGAPASPLNPGMAGSDARTPGSRGGYGSAGSASFPGPSRTEGAEVRYVKAHFATIRNAIIRKLSYPRLARRMGWTGTVKVSFVVNEDGGVNDVKVLATSGVEVLDNNAVETIRRCSPYPKPPCMAQMIMPITYRLDE